MANIHASAFWVLAGLLDKSQSSELRPNFQKDGQVEASLCKKEILNRTIQVNLSPSSQLYGDYDCLSGENECISNPVLNLLRRWHVGQRSAWFRPSSFVFRHILMCTASCRRRRRRRRRTKQEGSAIFMFNNSHPTAHKSCLL
jgi:hypothetical protein